MAHSSITHLILTDFRSYERTELRADGRSVYLHGPNGAGKTNVLEAISLLSPGRGLRGAALAEVGRRGPREAQGRAWAVSAEVAGDEAPVRIGTGVDAPGSSRRQVRIDGEPAQPGRLNEHLRPLWLTPAQDRLFLEAAGDRRRFLDRLVYADEPAHAGAVTAYERSARERMRLLTDGVSDDAWLTALEAQMAVAGAAMAAARARTLAALQAEIDQRQDRPFPQAGLSLTGDWERLALEGAAEAEIEARLAPALAAARPRDAAAGRGLTGPHRGDLGVVHRQSGRPAAEGSTGEQKALILNLILAQAVRLSRAKSAPNPILLLDEVAAHLDPDRRAALFDEITALGLQAFLTGTDEGLFTSLKGRALNVSVQGGQLHPTDD